jgi:hypothetical protein
MERLADWLTLKMGIWGDPRHASLCAFINGFLLCAFFWVVSAN